MRLFKNKWFSRYSRREGITDAELCYAVFRANRGVTDADLGSGVIKQRIARCGEGKSGGFRTILLFKAVDLTVFVYGFAKNERSNIEPDELVAFRKLAANVLTYDAEVLAQAVEVGAFVEIFYEPADEEVIQ